LSCAPAFFKSQLQYATEATLSPGCGDEMHTFCGTPASWHPILYSDGSTVCCNNCQVICLLNNTRSHDLSMSFRALWSIVMPRLRPLQNILQRACLPKPPDVIPEEPFSTTSMLALPFAMDRLHTAAAGHRPDFAH
jgi:hypothetical protein